MIKEMCKECPFRENSKANRYLNDWLVLTKYTQEIHSCHMLELDDFTNKIEFMCVGHLKYKENNSIKK